MIRIPGRKNDTDLTRLTEITTLDGADKVPVETTGGGDRRRWISFTNLTTNLAASVVNLVIPSGIMVPWLTTAAPTGWVLASGRTIGSAASGATERANADTATLYAILWQAFSNTELAIQDSAGAPTTRGASAADDFAANKRLPLPDLRDRTVIGLANMGGTDVARISVFDTTVIGKSGGADEVTLTVDNLPAHTHDTDVPVVSAGTGHSGVTEGTSDPAIPVTSSSVGADEPFSIIQPSIVLPFIIKL